MTRIWLVIAAVLAATSSGNTQNAPAFDFRAVAQPGTVIGAHTFTLETAIDGASLNDMGDVVFVARWAEAGTDHAAVFTSTRVIASAGEVIDGKLIVSIPENSQVAISPAGQVAYEATYSDQTARTRSRTPSAGIFVDKHLVLSRTTATASSTFALTDDGRIVLKDEPASGAPSQSTPKRLNPYEWLQKGRELAPKGLPIPGAIPKTPPQQRQATTPVPPTQFQTNRRGQIVIPINLEQGFLVLLGTPVTR